MPSPIGTLRLCASGAGLHRVDFVDGTGATAGNTQSAPDCEDASRSASAVLDQAQSELEAYFRGTRRAFDVPLDLYGTEFQQLIWRTLLDVPYGATITYGQLAAEAGRPAAIRAAGAANGANPLAVIVPCHRVVGSSGSLTGYGGGLAAKRWLLDLEQSVVGAQPHPSH